MTWLTTKAAAAELGLSERKVRELCTDGTLRAIWTGQWRIHP